MPATIEPAGTPVATKATISPLRFAGDLDVIAEDAQAVLEQANYSACNTPVHYAGTLSADANFLGGTQPSGDKVHFDAALNTWEERYRVHVKIGVNVAEVRFSARALFAATRTGEVRIKFDGNVRATLSFANSDNGSWKSDTVNAAGYGGAGYHVVTIEIRRTSADTSNQLVAWSLDGERVDPATLPAPTG